VTTATARFFEDLSTRPHDPRLEKADGTLCFLLSHEQGSTSWFVSVDQGDVVVTAGPSRVDPACTVRGSRALFDDIVVGRKNVMSGILRGDVSVDGDAQLLLLFQRLFPGPPGARHPRTGIAMEGNST
jgi:hypothetical protein